ncbi:unnamed protein product [Spirodela intermedia]|uniref:Dof zinc finger protein n=1 Tax=Spirodela intermedia TaxID=51605 RepID=A0A7I8KQD9_SPIIN|nr:unnamed protein product [Spirodela intermedia]
MDAALWPQTNLDTGHLEMGLVVMNPSMEEMASSTRPQLTERRPRPHKEQQLSCPRCQSTNTKFCYYNNYSLSQPRYFCKTCRRYWTEGGSLRNVPVGGGSRKNKRHSTAAPKITAANPSSSSPSYASSSSRRVAADLLPPPPTSSSFRNPRFHDEKGQQLAFTPMELLPAQGLSPFMPVGGADYTPVFGLQDFRSAAEVSYPLDAIGGGGVYGSMQAEVQESTRRGFFPFEDLRLVSPTTTSFEQNRGQGGGGEASGLWNGLMGGFGGSW